MMGRNLEPQWVNTVRIGGLQAKKTQLEGAGKMPDYRMLGNVEPNPVDSSWQASPEHFLENSKRPFPEKIW
jgi:hypothetical protein